MRRIYPDPHVTGSFPAAGIKTSFASVFKAENAMRTTKLFSGIFLLAALLLAACTKKKDPAPTEQPPAAETPAADNSNLPARLDMNAIPLAEVEKMAKVIEADANWFQQIKDKAAAGNVPVPIQLKDDARFFLYEHQAEYGIVQIPEDIVQSEIAKINADPNWLASVKKQAQERGISLEESLRKNALFVIDQRMK